MKEASSSRVNFITDSKAISLLMHPKETIYLKPFMQNALSVNEAAKKLNVELAFLYYRVKQFERAGILKKVAIKKRQGRPIALYKAVSDCFFVPFYATNNETLQQFLDSCDAYWQPALSLGIAAAYKASQLDEQDWGIHIDMMGDLMSFDVKPYPNLESESNYPKGIINIWDTRHYLSDEDVTLMMDELNVVLQKYLKKNTGPRKVIHLALADWSED